MSKVMDYGMELMLIENSKGERRWVDIEEVAEFFRHKHPELIDELFEFCRERKIPGGGMKNGRKI